jgi:hypothetical protein
MIFKFLRKYLKDDEFEQTKIELVETRQVLKEYKEFLVQFQTNNDERKKVDTGFLAFMWASVGIASSIFISTAQEAVNLKTHVYEPKLYIWLVLAMFSFYFVLATGNNALVLTKKFVDSKDDPSYRNYGWYLNVGVVLIALAILALAFLK